MKPLISVVMPAFNAQAFIAEAIDSIIMQIFDAWELIVVNDMSTDNTKEIVQAYTVRDGRVRLINVTAHQGQIGAHNVGIRESQADIVKVLHADDRLLPGALQSYYRAFQQYPSAVVVGAATRTIDERGQTVGLTRAVASETFLESTRFFVANILGWNPAWVPSAHAIRRDAFEACGLYEDPGEDLLHRDWGFDWYAIWKVAKQGDAVLLAEELVEYRRHKNQISSGGFDDAEVHMRYYWLRRIREEALVSPPIIRQAFASHCGLLLLMAAAASQEHRESEALYMLEQTVLNDDYINTYDQGRLRLDLMTWIALLQSHDAHWKSHLLNHAHSRFLFLLISTMFSYNVIAIERLTNATEPTLLLGPASLLTPVLREVKVSSAVVVRVTHSRKETVDLLGSSAKNFHATVVGFDTRLESYMFYDQAKNIVPLLV
ncbi:glycosyltransferase family 2 protein [Sulfobacillus sp. hq2]|uniref:glycosyltransferase family 2 protein n=1 Tax=Sulfobacillus TaxID=28033 RepID=UPI000CD226F0|nr:glycosyltransferase family 2 protein [Sulfobacillus sp. hq2]POB10345.1 hypothetical protein CO251_10360 [Sulfobacillus sp. hq2]